MEGFNAAAEEDAEGWAWELGTASSPRSESPEDPVVQLVYAEHDANQCRLRRGFPDSVEAVVQVVGDIFSRADEPQAAPPECHTRLWRGSIEDLDPNLLDRLPAITLARCLPRLLQTGGTGLSFFEPREAANALMAARVLTRELVSSICSSRPAAILGGSAMARPAALAVIQNAVEQGLETHRWEEDADPRYRRLGNALVEATDQISRADRAAMTHTAIDQYHQTRAPRPATLHTPAEA